MALTDPGGMTVTTKPGGTGQPTVGEQRYVYNPATGKTEMATWDGSGWVFAGAAPKTTSSGSSGGSSGSKSSGGSGMGSAAQSGVVDGGYVYREMPDGSVWAFRPDGSATVVMEAPAQQEPWTTVNLGGGKVIQIGPNGEVRDIASPAPEPAATPTDKYLGTSNGQLIIQKPDGSIVFQAIPGSTALKPASAQYTYTGPSGGSRPTASSSVDPYKGTQMQIDATARENEKNRQFQAQQQAMQDYQNLLQQATGLRFNAGESGIDRNMQGGWNEYQSAANNAQIELARRAEARQLAQQFQNAVQSANPIAMPALLAAGGGNISNAVSRGATALTDTFLTPQAEMLRQTRIPYDPLPVYDYVPETNPFIPALPTGPAAPPPPPAPAETAPPTGTGGGRIWRRGQRD